MFYKICDNYNLIEKLKTFFINSNSKNNIFLIRANLLQNNIIKLLETTCLNNYVSFLNNQDIKINQEVIKLNLKDFSENNNIFTLVHVYKNMVNSKTYNIPLVDFAFMYKIMKIGKTVGYKMPFIIIVIDSNTIKVEVYYKKSIYKDIEIIKNTEVAENMVAENNENTYILKDIDF
ncbi:hypothetical protein JYG23_11670 [Sedimentibacter sp. zth1]|uniref:hypothetical protein n=1 Tax=Sedimentibacter sp. zth1 TaxID=2816908 RepID=UPI001A936B92|nr:hypothetical protein [Sedimentibacter sp. zth1]QSX05328.1 hypothetical protein JYG23_11670 [Sedimentibacter sp. zth1]